MPTAIQKKRLVEGIAYIEAHRDLWDQSMWHNFHREAERNTCGTVGCLAGHLALTLNPSTPVVKVDRKVLSKPVAERTDQDHRQIEDMYSFGDYVKATSRDDPYAVINRFLHGKEIPVVHVRNRAASLIGLRIADSGGDEGLFAGRNNLSDIYRFAAAHIEVSQTELRKMVKAVITERGWDKTAAKRMKTANNN